MSINLHPGQSVIYKDLFIDKTHRFVTAVCSRGFGKSFVAGASAVTAVFELLELDESVPNKMVYIIAPTYDQVTDIYYPLLQYDLGMESYALRSSRDLGRFVFQKNVELRLLSYEAVERMRGKGAYFVVWDELSSCTKGISAQSAWEGIIQPCIITRWSPKRAKLYNARSPGRGLNISTPKGYNYLYTLYNRPEIDPSWGSYHFDYKQSPLLDLDEIERIKHTIDPIEFASEYLASFTESTNNVFYCFDRKIHVRKDLPYFEEPTADTKGEPVHVFIDFNVGLQCSSFWALRGNQLHCLDEFKGHPDTETLAVAIATQFKGHRIYAYPDPTGRARKTSAPVGRTDFSILESYGIQCNAHSKAVPTIDSVAAVNKKLMTAAGDVGIYISPTCTGVIESLERTKWVDKNPDTATIDKSEGIEHYSDGVRYGVEFLFPVQSGTKTTRRGFNF